VHGELSFSLLARHGVGDLEGSKIHVDGRGPSAMVVTSRRREGVLRDGDRSGA